MLVGRSVKVFYLFALIAVVIGLTASKATVVFVIFANTTSNSVAAANKSIDDLNVLKPNVEFRVDLYDCVEAKNDIWKYGEQLFKENASVMFHVSGSEKVSVSMSGLLRMPTFGIWRNACIPCRNLASQSSHRHHTSMMPSIKENSQFVISMMQKLTWQSIGIIYDIHRQADVNIFIEVLRGYKILQSLAPIDCRSNGTVIEENSLKRLKGVIDEKPSGIVVIQNEEKLQYLFDYLRSDSVGLQSSQSFIIFDPISRNTLSADNTDTVIAMHVDVQETVKLEALRNSLNKTSLQGKTIGKYAMLYDAVVSAGTIISDLISSNKWNSYRGTTAEQNAQRAANALELKTKLESYKDSGLTGNIEFDGAGYRRNMSFQIMGLQENSFTKIGSIDENGEAVFASKPKTNFNRTTELKVNGHLKIVTILGEPYLMKRALPNGTSEYYGLLIDIINELAQVANFTYSLYEVADGNYGHIVNGKWAGLVGDVLYKKADMAIAAITITATREEVVHFSTPYMEVTIGLVKKKQKAAGLDLLLFMEPFTTAVWSLIFTGCVVIGIFLFSVDYFSPFGWRQVTERASGEPGMEFDILNSIWFSMASILLQGADNTPRSLSGRILVGCFWFYVLILTSSYTANLAAFFTSSKANDQAIDLETLLKNGNTFTTIENYALEQFLKGSDYKVYNRVHERMVIQKSLANGTDDALRRISEDSYMYYLEEKPFIQWRINKKPCDLNIVDTSLPKTSFGFPMRKNAPFKTAISHGISKLIESGFLAERRNYYMDELSECKDLHEGSHGITHDGRIEPLQMLGAYSFLIGGIVVSVLVLLGELFWKRKIEERAALVKQRFRESMRKAGNKRMMSLQLKAGVQASKKSARQKPDVLEIAVKGFMEGKG